MKANVLLVCNINAILQMEVTMDKIQIEISIAYGDYDFEHYSYEDSIDDAIATLIELKNREESCQ